MHSKVDEAVADALHQMSNRRTGNAEIDAFLDQSLITLGGLVKITDMAHALDIHPTRKLLMKMNVKAYDAIIQEIAREILEGIDELQDNHPPS